MTTGGMLTQIGASEVRGLLLTGSSSVQLVDVRTALEFETEHIEGSINIPLDELGKRGGEIKKDRSAILVCRTGNRAGRAADLLASYGFDVGILTGGIVDWKKAHLPLKEGRKRLSLERQVQLAIGAILLASVSAGWAVNKGWFIVPAFIGAGLTFAGLTGNCGLALLLAKAPWNKLDSKTAPKSDGQSKSCCS